MEAGETGAEYSPAFHTCPPSEAAAASDIDALTAALRCVRLLLDALHEHDGRHDVSPETRDRVRTALEKAVQAAWLVHSPAGVQRWLSSPEKDSGW